MLISETFTYLIVFFFSFRFKCSQDSKVGAAVDAGTFCCSLLSIISVGISICNGGLLDSVEQMEPSTLGKCNNSTLDETLDHRCTCAGADLLLAIGFLKIQNLTV
ncbi:hypothetical protein Tsp_03998 [Trichinella spiralis]|uniref:hypothetical protein n=1 Tax=Trichinella spiralis TaxID=6334 RepID=UPI0001EFCCEB|nr:hypothetical protein Tsp_03998 [Trichinella spiralis]